MGTRTWTLSSVTIVAIILADFRTSGEDDAAAVLFLLVLIGVESEEVAVDALVEGSAGAQAGLRVSLVVLSQ